jgi:hypothetical protein
VPDALWERAEMTNGEKKEDEQQAFDDWQAVSS